MKIKEIINELTFHGRQCTKDCSGHKAGYMYAKTRGYDKQPGPSTSTSPSFNDGVDVAKQQVKAPKIRNNKGKFVKHPTVRY